jgi:hypothetical protein
MPGTFDPRIHDLLGGGLPCSDSTDTHPREIARGGLNATVTCQPGQRPHMD